MNANQAKPAQQGSLKMRSTARGISIRATGAAAQVLAVVISRQLSTLPGARFTTVTFEDQGQDFLEWDLDEKNVVTASRPHQNDLWVGTQVVGALVPGGQLQFVSRLGKPQTKLLKYPLVSVLEGLRA